VKAPGGGLVTVMFTWLLIVVKPSATLIVGVNDPAVVGVPDITPPRSVRPGGKIDDVAPARTLQVFKPVPFKVNTFCEYPVPTTPAESVIGFDVPAKVSGIEIPFLHTSAMSPMFKRPLVTVEVSREGVGVRTAVDKIASRICLPDKAGLIDSQRAAAPVTCGVAIDVPE